MMLAKEPRSFPGTGASTAVTVGETGDDEDEDEDDAESLVV